MPVALRFRFLLAWIVLSVGLHSVRPAHALEAVPRRLAPSLDGGREWINCAGPIALEELRGKFVILDFWTYCCINCLHTLPVLKRLEEAYPNNLVVIGVHAPKFFNERDADNIREAVVRYDISHPVVNDSNLIIARKYDWQVWPSLRVIDPQGFLIAAHSGETTFGTLNAFMRKAVLRYRRAGVLDTTPLRFDLERYAAEPTPLRFPGKVLADAESQRLFIADSGHHRVVITSLDGKLLDIVGSGEVGSTDGSYTQATFSHPQGLALQGKTLYVADTENHLIRSIDLAGKRVKTIAGTGRQGQIMARTNRQPTRVALASPWDLWLHEDDLYIAMAGSHQVWKMTVGQRPRIRPYAGNGTEDIVDGRLLPHTAFHPEYSSFAQPSGLASDGQQLYVADSEGSSIRTVPFSPNGRVATILGTARLSKRVRLFTFGDQNGPLRGALLQHPLCVAYAHGRLYVADTYNNKIKEIDLNGSTIKTIAGDTRPGAEDKPARFNEPAGLSIAGGKLYVADTNNHRIRIIDLQRDNAVSTLTVKSLKPPIPPESDTLPIVPGMKNSSFGAVVVNASRPQLKIAVQLALAPGLKLNEQAPMSYITRVTRGDKILATSADGKKQSLKVPAERFEFGLPLAQRTGTARLEISLVYFYCHEISAALCKVGRVNWSGNVKLTDTGIESVVLKHTVR